MTGEISVARVAEACEADGGAVRRRDTDASIVVVNETSKAVWTFNVRGQESGSWGHDYVEGALLSGERRCWWLEPGVYHLRATSADGDAAYHFGIVLQPGSGVEWRLRDG